MKISASDFDKELENLRDFYPKGVAYVSQNLFGSHDANRIGSHIVNAGILSFRDWSNYYETSKAAKNNNYLVRKPIEAELRLQKLFTIMQFTYVGAPMIYYGDEVGMWGANDPDCRKPMVWSDIEYEDEVYNPDQTIRTPDKVDVNYDLHSHYKKLIKIRNDNKALQIGTYKTLLVDDKRDIFIFVREYDKEKVIVVLNNSDNKQSVEISLNDNFKYSDLLNNREIKVEKGIITLEVDYKWGAVLLKTKLF
jgi:glycosidase